MDNQTQEMIDLLREQNQLLKKQLWRLRFSLTSLLLLTTAACLMLGYTVINLRPSAIKTKVTMGVPAPAGFASGPTGPSDLPQYYRMVTPQVLSAQRYPSSDPN